jgi:hypothetical protein
VYDPPLARLGAQVTAFVSAVHNERGSVRSDHPPSAR